MKKSLLAAAALAASAFALPASATVIGKTATVDYLFPDTSTLVCSSGTAVIGAGVEYPTTCAVTSLAVDIGDGTVAVSLLPLVLINVSPFNGISLAIAGFNFVSLSYTGGTLGVTGTSIADGKAFFNFSGQDNLSGEGAATANFTFVGRDSGGGGGQVSEPATLALLGAGLLGLAAVRRRKTA